MLPVVRKETVVKFRHFGAGFKNSHELAKNSHKQLIKVVKKLRTTFYIHNYLTGSSDCEDIKSYLNETTELTDFLSSPLSSILESVKVV